jgi:hypothetical protein
MAQTRSEGHHSRFTVEEDAQLQDLIEECGVSNWQDIADRMLGRNARQCRERWKHYLSGHKTHIPWTKQEDEILSQKVQELGQKWTKIAACLGDRTDLEVKNRWTKKFRSKSYGSHQSRCVPVQDSIKTNEPETNQPRAVAPESFIFQDPPDRHDTFSVFTDFVSWGQDHGSGNFAQWDISWE